MTTEQQEKDFKEGITVIIMVIVLIIGLFYVWPLVFGQAIRDDEQQWTQSKHQRQTAMHRSV